MYCVLKQNNKNCLNSQYFWKWTRLSFDPINNLRLLASCQKIFMGLALVHFQKYCLLRVSMYKVDKSIPFLDLNWIILLDYGIDKYNIKLNDLNPMSKWPYK